MTLRDWYEKTIKLETAHLGQIDADLFFSLIVREVKEYNFITEDERKTLNKTIFDLVDTRCKQLNFDTSDSFKVFVTEMAEGIAGVAVLYVSLAKIHSILDEIQNYKLVNFRTIFPEGLLTQSSEDASWRMQKIHSGYLIDKFESFTPKGIDVLYN